MRSLTEADAFFEPPDFKIRPPRSTFDSSLPSLIPVTLITQLLSFLTRVTMTGLEDTELSHLSETQDQWQRYWVHDIGYRCIFTTGSKERVRRLRQVPVVW